jgi:hypothetical protein
MDGVFGIDNFLNIAGIIYPMKEIQIQYLIDKNGCYNVISHKLSRGYPCINRRLNNQRLDRQRYVYTLCFGKIPDNLLVRHKCDNPRCINPDHLELGTQKDNVGDMVQRRRINQKGIFNNNSKLKDYDIQKIRKSELNNCQLAKIYNVTHQTIWLVKHKKSWVSLN